MTAPLPLPDVQERAPAARQHMLLTHDVELYGLISLLLIAPLAFGAVESWAIFGMESTTAILTVFWILRQVRSGTLAIWWNPIFLPMCAFAVLNAVQLIPGVSAYRYATRSALLLYISYGLACFLISQVLVRTTHLRRLAIVFCTYGAGVALFAVLEGLSSPARLYWVRTPYFGGWIYGPYVNHNHYAGLMEMLTPIPLVFAFSRYARGRHKWLAASAAAFMAASIFLSGSRGGMLAFTVEMAIFFLFLFQQRTRNRIATLLGCFLIVALVSIAYTGGSEVSSRIATVSSFKHPDLSTDIRIKIARDSLGMFRARPLLGWGIGTFADVFPQFRSFYTTGFINAAHDDYLQLLTETGIAGFGLMLWLLATAIPRALRKTKNWPSDVNGMLALAALLGISGILVHSAVDFNLEVPANAMFFYVLCTIAALDPRFRNLGRQHQPRETNTVAPLEECAV